MPHAHVSNLETRLAAVGLTLDQLSGVAKVAQSDVDQLARGVRVQVSDAAIARLANALDMKQNELRAGRGGGGGGDGDDGADAPASDVDAVYGEPSTRGAADGASAEVDWEGALAQAVKVGGFTREEGEVVLDTLMGGQAPSGVGRRDAPAFLAAWLRCARELREAGEDLDAGALVAAVAERAHPVAAKAARRMKLAAEESERLFAKTAAVAAAQRAERERARRGRAAEGDDVVVGDE